MAIVTIIFMIQGNGGHLQVITQAPGITGHPTGWEFHLTNVYGLDSSVTCSFE